MTDCPDVSLVTESPDLTLVADDACSITLVTPGAEATLGGEILGVPGPKGDKGDPVSVGSGKLLGRYAAGTGLPQDITVGANLELTTAGVLNGLASTTIGNITATSTHDFTLGDKQFVLNKTQEETQWSVGERLRFYVNDPTGLWSDFWQEGCLYEYVGNTVYVTIDRIVNASGYPTNWTNWLVGSSGLPYVNPSSAGDSGEVVLSNGSGGFQRGNWYYLSDPVYYNFRAPNDAGGAYSGSYGAVRTSTDQYAANYATSNNSYIETGAEPGNAYLYLYHFDNTYGGQVITVGMPNISTGASFTNYDLTLPPTAGSSGQVLTTDGTGVLSWTTASGFSGAFADLTGKPTTISGYGITDAFSGAFADLTGKPTTISGYGITDAFSGAFADLTGKPTTVAGYGITDAFSGAFSALSGVPTTVAGYGITDAVSTARTVSAGTGLSGGGDLSADRTLSLTSTGVTAGSYGSATAAATFTVDGQGRLTAAGSTTVTPAWSNITGTPTTLAGYGITNGATLGANTFTGAQTIGNGTLTASAPVLDLSQTWNNSGVTFTGIKANVTDTASAAASLLMDLQVGGSSKFKISKAGSILLPAGNNSAFAYNGGLGAYNFVGANNYQLYAGIDGGSGPIAFLIPSGSSFAFNSTNNLAAQTQDTFITRRGAANLRFGQADAAAPVAQTLSVQSVVAGTSNTAGANLTITSSQPTGTGTAGNINLSTAFSNTVGTATVTITIATPAVVTWTAHGLVTGSPVVFTTTGALPTGITAGTTYYAITSSTLGVNTFQIATSVANAQAGTAVATSGTQSGTHTGTTSATVQGPLLTTATLGPAGLTGSQSTSLVNLTQNWNTSGTPTAIKLNVNDTASNASSIFIDLQANGSSKFRVFKDGTTQSSTGYRSNVNSGGLSLAENGSFVGIYSNNQIQAYLAGATWAFGSNVVFAWSSGNATSGSNDLFLTRRGAANLRLGAADAAAPVAQTLSVQSVVAGTSNTAGANLTITGSQGTGTGAGGSIIFQVAPAGTSGVAQNALGTAMTIAGDRAARVVIGANLNIGTGLIAVDSVSDFTNTSTSSGIRFGFGAISSSGSNYSDGAGFQTFGGTHASLPGNVYFDYGSTARTISGSRAIWRYMSSGPTYTEVLSLNNNGLLQFGGTSASFPALKRSSATLQARLADDSGYTTIDAQLRAQGTAPATSTSTGTAGDIRYDSGYIYVCTAANTWVRAALSTF